MKCKYIILNTFLKSTFHSQIHFPLYTYPEPRLPEVLADMLDDMEDKIEDETCLIDELAVTVADPETKVWNEF